MADLSRLLLRLVPRNRGQRVIAGAVVVVVVGAVLAIVLTSGGNKNHPSASSTTSSTSTTPVSTTICPLTDTPAPGGHVPDRPALLVKIGNEPEGARPQSGLNEADIVFDTPAEGFIMRYVAVYQCNSASLIGPTRSLRWIDYRMVAKLFGSPIIAFAGGINPNIDAAESLKWLHTVDLLDEGPPVANRISSRVPPDNLYTSTSALYGLYKTATTPPEPIFDYSASTPSAMSPVTSFGIDFSYGTDVVWRWQAASKDWLHTYSGSPDTDTLTNQAVTTTNIAVMIVHYRFGPYVESIGGSGDVESYLQGSGTGYVLRDGRDVKVTWHRKTQYGKITFTDAAGNEIDLAPGRTWVEIVPITQAEAPGGITITR